LDGQELRIVAPEDFVLLKVLSTRERDLEDARTVLSALAGRLDDELIDREANALAIEIADHDVLRRYSAIRA
jgi:predicted nucleotidyltransferase